MKKDTPQQRMLKNTIEMQKQMCGHMCGGFIQKKALLNILTGIHFSIST